MTQKEYEKRLDEISKTIELEEDFCFYDVEITTSAPEELL